MGYYYINIFNNSIRNINIYIYNVNKYWVPALRRIEPQKGVLISCGLWGKLCRKQTCDCHCCMECVVAFQEW